MKKLIKIFLIVAGIACFVGFAFTEPDTALLFLLSLVIPVAFGLVAWGLKKLGLQMPVIVPVAAIAVGFLIWGGVFSDNLPNYIGLIFDEEKRKSLNKRDILVILAALWVCSRFMDKVADVVEEFLQKRWGQ